MAKNSRQKKSTDNNFLVITTNKKARRDYEITETFEAGLVLAGSEVKAIRAGSINLKDSYVRHIGQELILVGCHISPYSHSSSDAHEVERDRKLLLHRREIDKLGVQVTQKGLSLIPMRVYFKAGLCKLEIGLGRGKKLYDKREDIKSREAMREVARAIKSGLRR